MTLGIACLAGFALAWAAGAKPRLLSEVRLRWTGCVFASLALQLATFAIHVPLPRHLSTTGAHIGSYVLLLAFAARNGRVPGFMLAGLGLASNALAITSSP